MDLTSILSMEREAGMSMPCRCQSKSWPPSDIELPYRLTMLLVLCHREVESLAVPL